MKIGVIGYGHRGYMLQDVHQPARGFSVAALADPDPLARARFREKYGSGVFLTPRLGDLLERADVPAVVILSPDWRHEKHAVAALRAGKHVYLEKPMAITLKSADRILAAAARSAGTLFVGHNQRHAPYVRKMKALIEQGAIGEPKAGWCRHFVAYGGDAYYKDWHAERAKCTGLLIQKGCHDIDALHWLCGGVSRRVVALGGLTLYDRITDRRRADERPDVAWRLENWPPLSQKKFNPKIEVEDVSLMLMELDNGVFCSYEQCHYSPDAWRNYTIIGEAGRVENIGPLIVRLWNRRTGFREKGHREFRIVNKPGGHGGADPAIVNEFFRVLEGRARPSISPVAAREAVAAGYCATLSLRARGAPRDVPPPDPAVAARLADRARRAAAGDLRKRGIRPANQ